MLYSVAALVGRYRRRRYTGRSVYVRAQVHDLGGRVVVVAEETPRPAPPSRRGSRCPSSIFSAISWPVRLGRTWLLRCIFEFALQDIAHQRTDPHENQGNDHYTHVRYHTLLLFCLVLVIKIPFISIKSPTSCQNCQFWYVTGRLHKGICQRKNLTLPL